MAALGSVALVTTSLRAAPLARLRARAGELGLGPVRVIKARGRRAGASEELVEELLNTGVVTVVLASLSRLHPEPSIALGLLAAIRSCGLHVVALADGWASDAEPETLRSVASYLAAEEARKKSRQGRSAIAVARVAQRRIGRPRVPIDIERARALLEQHGSFRRAARELQVGATTLRRALRAA